MKVFHTDHGKKKNMQKQATVTIGIKNSIMWHLSQ